MNTGKPLSLFAGASRWKTIVGYAGMTASAVGAYFWIRSLGERMTLPQTGIPKAAETASGSGHVLAEVLLALAVIAIMARLVGRAVEKYLKQPPVMGEILAGIMLGPSVLGAISNDAYLFLMPPEAAPYLGILAKVGVVLFMFLVGIQLDAAPLRSHSHSTLAISHASILAPFTLGAALALVLYPIYATGTTSFTVFSLFLGVSMSVTAFPVLARILTDRRIQSTPLGVTAIACAAVDDATAWCLLAFVSGVATAQLGSAATTVGLAALYVAAMFVAVRPFARWLADREERSSGPVSPTVLAFVIGLMLFSAVATESIGIHALFGAFLFGAFIPHDSRLAGQIRARIEDLVVVLLLPIFFAFTGMRTQIGLLGTAADWMFCVVIILVATAGKFGGSFIAARLSGLGWRESGAIGVLMNTRGLMELIVLNVGLDMDILSPTLFAMLVIMALVTTFSTTPALQLIMGRRGLADAPAPAPTPAGSGHPADRRFR
jgi:Kef-type K+ transport system membrane component KefB